MDLTQANKARETARKLIKRAKTDVSDLEKCAKQLEQPIAALAQDLDRQFDANSLKDFQDEIQIYKRFLDFLGGQLK